MIQKQSIRIEYKPLSTSDSATTLSGNQRQTYDVNTGYFHPDRRLDPLTLLVTCEVLDPHNLVSGVVNSALTDVMWKINGDVISSTNAQFKIGQNEEKGKLTIYKNISDSDDTTIEFEAKYMEPKSKRVAKFQRSFSLITVTEAVAQAELKLTAPIGSVQFPFVNQKGLVLQADLMRSAKKVPAAYYWKRDGVELDEKTDRLVVTDASKAGNVFQVEVADCTEKFNELVSEKVEADAEVVEWRGLLSGEGENLIIRKSELKNYWVDSYGYIVVSTGHATTDYIEVLPGSKYWFTKITNTEDSYFRWAWYDKDKNYLGRKPNPEDIFSYIVPSYVKYLRISYPMQSSPKFEKGDTATNWSPSKLDLQELITQKTAYYAEQTSLPQGYRPSIKPDTLYKSEKLLKKSYGDYDVEIHYPEVVNPDTDFVQFEAVFNNNKGVIENASDFFTIGWWKKADGTYEYKGLKIKVPFSKIEAFIASGKGVEYEIIEL
ncbi:hypothetical protein [Myroides pelagicus]|uniref:Uncharacterized protein n=1 Tax=Myroides pelagicus TaxID=270914 RepID=A0A7K1GH97_9FLAO|nr:hypothetical protein [Myroides pelagicus]MTH28397.1 hypothetical protein [Myroides pelagicus]